MNHIIITPVLLPAILGPLIIFWMRHDLLLQRVFSVIGTMIGLAVALLLAFQVADGDIQVYRFGNWAAPFGIVLVLDRLAAMMLVLTMVLALVVQFYAIGSGWDRRGWHFHALWQFQLMGISGAFLTGDAFNLFVFFEVMLIASYGLMIHGGGGMRLRAGVQYVVYNLAGSTLFLAALGTLYAVTGTLNMADMAARVAEMPDQDTALLRTGAILLILVFAIKSALVPLHFWLPSTYANAPGPVSALFAIMTKVGVYAIIRVLTLVFPSDSVIETIALDLLLPAALFSLVLGQIGVLGGRHLGRMAAFATVASVGTLMVALIQMTEAALAAGLYYMLHSTLAGAALFLVVDMIGARRRGDLWLHLRPGIANAGLIAALFFMAAIAVVGLPPLSGFLGKLLVMQVTAASPWWVTIWAVILVTSAFALVGFARAGSMLFWKPHEYHSVPEKPEDEAPSDKGGPIPVRVEPDEPFRDVEDASAPWLAFASVGALLAGVVVLSVMAGPISAAMERTAAQLANPAEYIGAVLENQEGTR